MIGRTVDFFSALEAAHDLDGVWAGLSAFAEGFGFDRTMVGATRQMEGQPHPVPIRYRSNLPKLLFEEYVGSGRYAEDPMFIMAHLMTRPFGSHLDWYRDAALTKRQRELFESEIVQDSPFRVVMPVIRSPGGVRWSVVLGSGHASREVASVMAQAGPLLWLAAAAVGHRLLELERSADADRSLLTPRERECLTRLASGDRVDRIAERLGLSTATVEMHLRNARHKLGARTSPEAVAKAILRRWIVP